jgi:hypothetical protein
MLEGACSCQRLQILGCSVRPTSETARRGPTTGIQMLRLRRTRSLPTRVILTVSCRASAASYAAIVRP